MVCLLSHSNLKKRAVKIVLLLDSLTLYVYHRLTSNNRGPAHVFFELERPCSGRGERFSCNSSSFSLCFLLLRPLPMSTRTKSTHVSSGSKNILMQRLWRHHARLRRWWWRKRVAPQQTDSDKVCKLHDDHEEEEEEQQQEEERLCDSSSGLSVELKGSAAGVLEGVVGAQPGQNASESTGDVLVVETYDSSKYNLSWIKIVCQ